VFADQYPYEASSTSLGAAVLPDGGGSAALRTAIDDPALRAKVLADAKENIRRRGGPASIVIASAGGDRTLAGKNLDQIAKARSVAPEQAAIDVILAGGASIVSFNMSEDDIRTIMRQPWTMASSDGGLSLPGPSMPHPRNNGAFARRLAVYVRERNVISLEQAIRTMTSLPARVFGFTDRGEIRAWGMGLNLVEPALACLEAAKPDLFLIAGRYTLLDHTALGELFPACLAKGVKIVLGGPYNSGLLAGGTTFNYEPAKADMVARADAVRALCARHGTDIKAAALQFCAAHPAVAAVIPGPRSAAEVEQNAALMQAEIPGALWTDLRRAGLLPETAPTPER
jgi:hypothetical protein